MNATVHQNDFTNHLYTPFKTCILNEKSFTNSNYINKAEQGSPKSSYLSKKRRKQDPVCPLTKVLNSLRIAPLHRDNSPPSKGPIEELVKEIKQKSFKLNFLLFRSSGVCTVCTSSTVLVNGPLFSCLYRYRI